MTVIIFETLHIGFSKQVGNVEGQKERKVGLMEKESLDGEHQTKRKGVKVCQKRAE